MIYLNVESKQINIILTDSEIQKTDGQLAVRGECIGDWVKKTKGLSKKQQQNTLQTQATV